MSYSTDENYIKLYLERWEEEGLPVWINADNWAEVNENCRRCLEEGKNYAELFGVEKVDRDVLY